MRFRALSAPGPKKSETESKESQNRLFFNYFDSFFDSVLDFLGPAAERAREPIFELYLQLSARKAQMTPVTGPETPNLRDF